MQNTFKVTAIFSTAIIALAACGETPPLASSGSGQSSTVGTGGMGGAGAGGGTEMGGGGMGGDGGAPIDKAMNCASTFGDALTADFGRVDGTVLAVVQPKDTQCPLPNNDHVIIQITMLGKVYRMVVNLQSSFGDPNVQYLETTHKLVGPVWEEGWHTGISLDYVNDLGLQSAQFTPYDLNTLSMKVTDAVTLGQKISVYAHSSGGSYAGSAHKVHRNTGAQDGAIVLDPESASPKMLVFHFANQVF